MWRAARPNIPKGRPPQLVADLPPWQRGKGPGRDREIITPTTTVAYCGAGLVLLVLMLITSGPFAALLTALILGALAKLVDWIGFARVGLLGLAIIVFVFAARGVHWLPAKIVIASFSIPLAMLGITGWKKPAE